jgi:PIN domain nuclease of toxin-antitoxin system
LKYLLDTSVFLWSRSAEYNLNSGAKAILSSAESNLYFSAASSWEIAIKYSLGSLKLQKPPSDFVPEALRSWAILSLDITQNHALLAETLPSHHRDPFDRMLIAQARAEGMTLLTADSIFRKYDVKTFFCGK